MNDPGTYILSKLQQTVVHYPMIKCIYQYDDLTEVHVVRISPEHYIEYDSALKRSSARILFDFIGDFPAENLYFTGAVDAIDQDVPFEEVSGQWAALLDRSCEMPWPVGFRPDLKKDHLTGNRVFPKDPIRCEVRTTQSTLRGLREEANQGRSPQSRFTCTNAFSLVLTQEGEVGEEALVKDEEFALAS